jgi:TonB family protein
MIKPSGASASGPRSTAVEAAARDRYIQALSQVLRAAWDQPSRAEVGGRSPVVTVALEISASGNLTLARITRESGVTAMDASVRSVLERVKRFPPPRDYGLTAKSFHTDISFALD